MKNRFRSALSLILCVGLSVGLLSGCGKKDKAAFKEDEAAVTLNDTSMNAGVANFILRYEQSVFENGVGQMLRYYGYTDIWNSDIMGSGEPYSATFKEEMQKELEQMMLAAEHAADYKVELTDDEKKQISDTAEKFIADNDDEVLKKMSATQENVEAALTYFAVKSKVETEMVSDVDTNVSDEEAMQHTVDYVSFIAETESETEKSSEALSEAEDLSEAAEELPQTEEIAAATEADTDAKTGAADSTEAETAVTKADTESEESAAEDAAEGSTEAVSEAETETESEDPAMIAARAVAEQKAEDFLARAKEAKDAEAFEKLGEEVSKDDTSVNSSSYTFGDDDNYPDSAIIEASKDLKDNTPAEKVVRVNNTYYVLYMKAAFDKEATEQKKDEIVEQRRQDKIQEVYDGWEKDEKWTVNTDLFDKLTFDFSLVQETEPYTEAVSEAEELTEAVTEAGTENAEGASEAVSVS